MSRSVDQTRTSLPLRTSEQLKAPFRKAEDSSSDGAQFRNSEDDSPTFRKTESSLDQAYSASAQLFDAALIGAKLRNQDVAALLGVSESLVQKWRSPDARACPSHVQMLQLPLSFHLALHGAMNKRYGFARAALRRLLDAAGDLALAMEA